MLSQTQADLQAEPKIHTHAHTHMHTHALAHTDVSVLELAETEVSTRDLLSLLWIQVTEGDSVEGVVSSEEEPVARTSDKQSER